MTDDPQAGDALNALIASRLFGFSGIGYYGPPTDPTVAWAHELSVRYDTREEAQEAYRVYYEARYPDEASRRGRAEPDDGNLYTLDHWKDGWGPLYVPEYSDDPAAALAVVERLLDWGYFWSSSATKGGLWSAIFVLEATTRPSPMTVADTLPLAICRAALAVMEQPS